MKKYIDSKNGIYTDGYNHYVVDLGVYPFLTDAATIDNADEVLDIFNKVHAHGGQLSVKTPSGTGGIIVKSVDILALNGSTKALSFVAIDYNSTGASIQRGYCTYLAGTWTVALYTATTAWDT